MFQKIKDFVRSNFSVEKTDYFMNDLMMETFEFKCFSFLYDNFVLDDFATFGRKNYINKDFENFVFNDINYYNLYYILNDSLIIKIINEKRENGEKINFLNLASGVGKFALFMNIFHKIDETTAVENIYELCRLSKYMLSKLCNSKENVGLLKTEKENIHFINDSIFNLDYNPFNIILINHNNNNFEFNNILEKKIHKNCKKGTLIIKILDPFEESRYLKLLKMKSFKLDNGGKFMIYFYKVK